MNADVQIHGLNNAWTMPIKTRIDMLATGIKTSVGIKITSHKNRVFIACLRSR